MATFTRGRRDGSGIGPLIGSDGSSAAWASDVGSAKAAVAGSGAMIGVRGDAIVGAAVIAGAAAAGRAGIAGGEFPPG